MTRRLVKAIQHPRAHILAHPTGRLLGRREPYELDMEEVVKAARDHGVMLEINAQPHRLDLNDAYVYLARQAGVKLVISTDVPCVYLDYKKPGQRALSRVDAEELRALYERGEFPAGSMGPKIQSALRFLENGRVDDAFECPAPLLIVKDKAAQLLAVDPLIGLQAVTSRLVM